jgi:signal transduction histidine kinase
MSGQGSLMIALEADGTAGGANETDRRTNFVRLSVIDKGCGMDKATLDRAFEPFFTTKPIGQGTGLGLPVVYGLVNEMGGKIEIDSKLGVGTNVTVLIPRYKGEMNDGVDLDSRGRSGSPAFAEDCVAG